jgi:hypothetical protein
MVTTALSVATGQIAAGHAPQFRPIVGIGVVGFALLAAANSDEWAPVASKFATLIATTALLTSGYYTAAALVRYLNPPK